MSPKSFPTIEHVCERYQWMCNRQGGQHFGTREEIRVLTDAAFREYIRPRLMRPKMTFAQYRDAYPSVTHYSVIVNENNAGWRFNAAGALAELRPSSGVKHWVLKVDDFSTPEAIAWGKTPDDSNDAPRISVSAASVMKLNTAIRVFRFYERRNRRVVQVALRGGLCAYFGWGTMSVTM
jgi:hypothetical protein